jgi:V/A-type H+-transporting ATPase subunit I
MLLGLVIGAVSAFAGHRRQAIGRGLAAVMLVLVILALLASVEVVPRGLLTPVTVIILITFPIMIVVEGVVAPVEFLSTLGKVLSYSRIMALGTASVMLAVVANEMAGAFGSVIVGVIFALLFHLVNFALGVMSPAIHALRLHYVEFFGNFYSPGGVAYRPFGHGTPPPSRAT